MIQDPHCVTCDKEICPGDEFEGKPMCDNCAEGLEEKRETLLEILNTGTFA